MLFRSTPRYGPRHGAGLVPAVLVAANGLAVDVSICGTPCLGLNGGPAFKHSGAFSFVIATHDQADTDRLWNAIVDNGGWVK